MAVPFEIEPEALLIPMRVELSRWHIIDAERALTWCGLFLSQGSARRPFSQTPEERRCQICIDRFGEGVLRNAKLAKRQFELEARQGRSATRRPRRGRRV